MIVAPSRPCSGCGVTTWREDGLCNNCWGVRERIQASEWQAELESFIRALEREWRMLDRIDYDQRRRRQ